MQYPDKATGVRLPFPALNRFRARRACLAGRWPFRHKGLVQRTLALLVMLPGFVLLLPLLALVALSIMLCDGGPMLLRQRRVRRHGRKYAFPRSRSMCVDAEAVKAQLHANSCPVLHSAVQDEPRQVLLRNADRCPEAARLMELVFAEGLVTDDGGEAVPRWSGHANVMPVWLPHLDDALVKFKGVAGHEG